MRGDCEDVICWQPPSQEDYRELVRIADRVKMFLVGKLQVVYAKHGERSATSAMLGSRSSN